MAEASPLAALAERHGVALEYHDIWGKAHRASAASLTAILAAMGVHARSDQEAAAELRAEAARRWRQLVPAAVVVRTDRPHAKVRLNLPAALEGERLGWRLEEEAGTVHAGEFSPGALPAIAGATVDGVAYAARELALPPGLAPGYHRLKILRNAEPMGDALLVVAPSACYRPPVLDGDGRVWGAAVQLYAVRSERNWGIGDFTDLGTIVEQWGGRGASIVGVNPLHALFPHNPGHASPYSPSSRLFLNALYLDVEAVEDFRECEEVRAAVRSAAFRARLKALREAELVDYAGVAEAKAEALGPLYAHFRARHLAADTARARAFREFQSGAGEQLRRHALFEALQERFHRAAPSIWGWPVWPEAFRHPASTAVAEFAAAHAERVEFFEYLQWQASRQLAGVGRRAVELGLGVGLYVDLAVSIDRGGAEAWANRDLYATAVSVGAPPDDFNQRGQNWGLPPFVPDRLREAAYDPFIATLRANMRHAGALRIDHAMGLMRLFWVPPHTEATDGAYVHYPFDDLLGILALESHRNRCLVIGEDLGTVPDAVRRAFAEFGVLSCRVLLFERTAAGDFKPPADYAAHALVSASTHDLPTLAGWWEGRDAELRHELGLLSAEEARRVLAVERPQDRARLLRALEREQLLPQGATVSPVPAPKMTPELVRAVHAYLARSPAQVLVVQLEDVLGAHDQVNLPATTGEQYPNWRRKLGLALERWPEDDRFVELANALARVRGRPPTARPRREGAAAATIPRATYRLQLHRDFTFADATAVVPYLAALGASHVYCSPYLRARAGSRHGYDIIDHGALNPELGDRDDFERFAAALKAHGMGQLLDMVPNHMGVMGADNAWWMDVLENGPASAYAEYFDIDWLPLDPALAGKVLLPVLGEHYGNVLERGELALGYEPGAGAFAVRYFAHRFPIDPREYPRILERAAKLAGPGALPAEGAAELESLTAAFRRLPARSET
ncbi:MAG: 4-alpha-glucanotransferase, partial [Burkholderiales bacterium]